MFEYTCLHRYRCRSESCTYTMTFTCRYMNRYTSACRDACVCLQMDGWMDGWMDGCMHACMHAWMDGWMDGWMDERLHGHARTWPTLSLKSLALILLSLCSQCPANPSFLGSRAFRRFCSSAICASTNCKKGSSHTLLLHSARTRR